MTATMWRLACASCQVIARPGEYVSDDRDDRPDLTRFLADHRRCNQLTLVVEPNVDTELPVPTWVPRPLLGPPLPGHAQRAVCPECNAAGGDGPRDQVTWKATTAGEPFVFCRACGNTWGPGVDAEYARARLRRAGSRQPTLADYPGGPMP